MADTPPVPQVRVPDAWHAIDQERINGRILVIGATDSGKSTFTRWLAGELSRHQPRVGWLDGDPGQSTLGPPATLNLALLDAPPGRFPVPEASFFLGSTSPKGQMLPHLTGLHRLAVRAEDAGCGSLVIDTTGLVDEPSGGAALKQWLIELLRPRWIFALQRQRELEHLLIPLSLDRRFDLQVLPVAGAARRRDREDRAARRALKFREYFASAGRLNLRGDTLPLYGDPAEGRLLGLLEREGWLLGLGVSVKVTTENLEVVTPWREAAKVAAVRVGALFVDPGSGEEIGRG